MKRTTFLKAASLGLLGGFIAPRLKASDLSIEDFESATFFDPLARVGDNHIPNKSVYVMKNIVIHKAESRGKADHGWLKSNHSFSFANHHNPDRMHFGVLRVLNDDYVEGGKGFGTHPHNNMEIISIPLEGDLEHQDNMGNKGIIKQGDVQVMSAGTGIQHSEYNKNQDRPVKFLQIWLFPNKKNVRPRYDQMSFDRKDRHNHWQQVLSPDASDEGVWIHQNAWFHMGQFDADTKTSYTLKSPKNGIYLFLISGKIRMEDQTLDARDGCGIWDVDQIDITIESDAEMLLMDVPMQLG